MSTIQTTQDGESDLQQQLKQVEYDTLDGNRCLAEITEIKKKFGDINITVELPSGRKETESYDVPEIASDEYEFVRLLRQTGYSLSTIDHAVGVEIPVEITEDGTEIVVPEPDKTFTERVHENIPDSAVSLAGTILIILTIPLTMPYTYKAHHIDEWGWEPNNGEVFLTWCLATMIWGCLVALPLLFLFNILISTAF